MLALRSIGPEKSVVQIAPPEEVEHDLLINPREPAAAGTFHLSDHGGSTIRDPRLVLIFVGGATAFWADWQRVQDCARDLMERGYLDPLEQYGSGSGSLWGAVDGPPVPAHVKDSDLQAYLRDMLDRNLVPPADGHTLYALCLPAGVGVSFDDARGSNCSSFCGYHSALDASTFYSVQPAPHCGQGGGCTGGRDPFDAFTMVLAHEIAEACSDAWPGNGWFEDANGAENADLCAWQDARFGPWAVQPFWTNETGPTVGAWRDADADDGGPSSQGDCRSRALAAIDANMPLYRPKTKARREAMAFIRDVVANAEM